MHFVLIQILCKVVLFVEHQRMSGGGVDRI